MKLDRAGAEVDRMVVSPDGVATARRKVAALNWSAGFELWVLRPIASEAGQ